MGRRGGWVDRKGEEGKDEEEKKVGVARVGKRVGAILEEWDSEHHVVGGQSMLGCTNLDPW